MSDKLEKIDWENAKKQFESLKVNSLLNLEIYESALEIISKRIKEFPIEEKKEDDPMPEELKNISGL